jgi:hypothetical protein
MNSTYAMYIYIYIYINNAWEKIISIILCILWESNSEIELMPMKLHDNSFINKACMCLEFKQTPLRHDMYNLAK